MRSLVWFRADLRTQDNPALTQATRDADRGVVAVFVLCRTQWRKAHHLSDAKVDLMLRTLTVLKKDLEKLNIPLKVIDRNWFDEVPAALKTLCRDVEADALYFNREYEVNEQQRDEAVTDALEDVGLKVHAFTDQVAMDPGLNRTQKGDFYSVFTPFKKSWIAAHKDGKARDAAESPRKQPEMACESDEIPDRLPGFERTGHLHDRWPAGEHEALDRLSAFCDKRIADYHEQRDTPSLDGTSGLSPYLANGSLSPIQCLNAALEANNNRLDTGSQGAATWISEIIWREFYRHILVGFPRVCRHKPFKLETESIRWEDNDEHFEAWAEGRTGVPIVDAAMRQLLETGWMHNRLRMIVAMFFSKDLFLDWRRGERFFSEHLIDLDLASNNGGWQWSASTGVDAAPYFRIFNPFSQSKKCDPDGTFIRRYVPELKSLSDKTIHEPAQAKNDLFRSLDYPEPIVDHSKARERAIRAFKDNK